MKRLIIFILCIALVMTLACDDSGGVKDVQERGGEVISDTMTVTNPIFEAWQFIACIDDQNTLSICE